MVHQANQANQAHQAHQAHQARQAHQALSFQREHPVLFALLQARYPNRDELIRRLPTFEEYDDLNLTKLAVVPEEPIHPTLEILFEGIHERGPMIVVCAMLSVARAGLPIRFSVQWHDGVARLYEYQGQELVEALEHLQENAIVDLVAANVFFGFLTAPRRNIIV